MYMAPGSCWTFVIAFGVADIVCVVFGGMAFTVLCMLKVLLSEAVFGTVSLYWL